MMVRRHYSHAAIALFLVVSIAPEVLPLVLEEVLAKAQTQVPDLRDRGMEDLPYTSVDSRSWTDSPSHLDNSSSSLYAMLAQGSPCSSARVAGWGGLTSLFTVVSFGGLSSSPSSSLLLLESLCGCAGTQRRTGTRCGATGRVELPQPKRERKVTPQICRRRTRRLQISSRPARPSFGTGGTNTLHEFNRLLEGWCPATTWLFLSPTCVETHRRGRSTGPDRRVGRLRTRPPPRGCSDPSSTTRTFPSTVFLWCGSGVSLGCDNGTCLCGKMAFADTRLKKEEH
jgi:hypothetical protein